MGSLSDATPISFERLLQQAQGLSLPENDDKREVLWCDIEHVVGLSRQRGGAIELFLRGGELHPTSPLVKRHMKFDRWTRRGGEIFEANRLVLPSDEHYVPEVAFLAEELLRRGVTHSLARGFAQTEPLIEMALRRTSLGDEEILGLIGELRFLEVLLSVAEGSGQRALAVDAWRGHERGSRDFVLGPCSVEVKSTRGDRSAHRVNSVAQVDPRRSEANEPQEALFLLSLGFRPETSEASATAALSLPAQVDAVLLRLDSAAEQGGNRDLSALLLEKVSRYGSPSGRGYEHEEMRRWSAYQGRWQQGFVRIYDMGDDAIQVLRRDDIQRRNHVVLSSVSFDIVLPDRVSGDLNPQSDLFALARRLLNGGAAETSATKP